MAKRFETPKDPDEVLDYQIDWSAPLAGDVITTSTWTVPTGLVGGIEQNTNTTTTIWLSGGTLDQDYQVHNRITTAAGRTRDQTCILKVRAK
jgi:hypothetical protein